MTRVLVIGWILPLHLTVIGVNVAVAPLGSESPKTKQSTQCPPISYPIGSVSSPSHRYAALVLPDSHMLNVVRLVRERDRKTLGQFRTGLTNLLWLPNNRTIVYAVSPIYDVPGIYLFDIRKGRGARVVAAQNLTGNPGYKDGADWFMLCSVSPRPKGAVVYYLRFDDVDALDFRNLPLTAPQDSVFIPDH